jgi:hypothetical protein
MVGVELVALINGHVKLAVNYFLLRCPLTTQAASMFLIQTEKRGVYPTPFNQPLQHTSCLNDLEREKGNQ